MNVVVDALESVVILVALQLYDLMKICLFVMNVFKWKK